MKRPLSLLASTAVLLTGGVVAPLVTAAPAHADCATFPSARDINVTRKVYEIGQARGVDHKLMLAMFEAGWVESTMNNLNCGDRDSLGVFQMRPSQNWGTAAQVTNVTYAANKWISVALPKESAAASSGALAQAVEVSAYPGKYDAVQGTAQSLMDEAFQPYGKIGDKWHAIGGTNSVVGAPIRAEADSKLGGRFTQFQKGIIIWRDDVGAHEINGEILNKFWATNSEQAWGFPTMDEAAAHAAPDGTTGRYQYFQNALFTWSAPTGPRIIHGEILKAFENNGREAVLGYPTSDETDDGHGGRIQQFQAATIDWTSTGGSVVTPK